MKQSHLIAVAVLLVASTASVQAQDRGRGRGNDPQHPQGPPPVSQQEQQRRIHEEQQRSTAYQHTLDAQVRAAQARTAQIQAQQRATAQLAAQQRYAQQLQAQQAAARAQRDYSHDAYISSPLNYRYRFNGVSRQTNQYGADALRTAVSNGYSTGYQQGRADRADGASSKYSRSFAYQDANYGYNGAYVAQGDYNYYFRQGFRDGYSDGYNSQTRYGSFSNGNASILGNILTGILGLTTIH